MRTLIATRLSVAHRTCSIREIEAPHLEPTDLLRSYLNQRMDNFLRSHVDGPRNLGMLSTIPLSNWNSD